jgi:hypothetical protein
MLSTIRSLQQQVDLKELLCELFMPALHVSKVKRLATWDEQQANWVLPAASEMAALASMPISQAKRPTTAGAALRSAF